MKSCALMLESWGSGGTESYVEGLAKFLIANGYDVYVILLKPGRHSMIEFLPRDRVICVTLRKVPEKIRNHGIRSVNLHLYSSLLPVTVICKMLGVNIITTLHMPLKSWGGRHRVYWQIAIRLANRVVGVSRLVNKQVGIKNLYPEPIPGGIYSDFFKVERKCKSCDDGGMLYRIFAVGRLSKEKDWPTLVRAVSLLPDTYRKKIVIDFFGDGVLSSQLHEFAESLDVSVTMHGFVSKERLAIEFEGADLSVLPSRFEGFGLAAIESMAAGVPTITSDFEASNDFIKEEETGYRFPAGNADALSLLILKILENPLKADEIAQKGRDFVYHNFSEEKTYFPYLKLLGCIE